MFSKTEIEKMDVAKLVDLFSIRKAKNNSGMIEIRRPSQAKKEGLLVFKARKPEIVAYLDMLEKQAAEKEAEREAKIKAIEGLEELKDAVLTNAAYWRELEKSFVGENAIAGLVPGGKPDIEIDALKKKYPRAVAYLVAEEFMRSNNSAKYCAGEKAKERIINGEDYETVIADMKKEWSDYCTDHIWD